MATTTALSARTLADVDPDIARAIESEIDRQETGLELIASENFVSAAVLEATGTVFTNKYAEGYPGRRYYGGCENVDVVESLAIGRAKALFGAEHANVQPHSGAQANMAVFLATLKPGDTILGMNLSHGGHLTHGHPLNFSGKYFNVVPYGVRADDERLDYDALAALAQRAQAQADHRRRQRVPARVRLSRGRARSPMTCGALLMTDMAHIAGLVAAGVHPSPGSAFRLRDDDDPQDVARTASRHGVVPDGVREGCRQGGLPRHPGRAAGACDRREGRLPEGSEQSRRLLPTSGRSWPTRRASPRSSPAAAIGSSAAARTIT